MNLFGERKVLISLPYIVIAKDIMLHKSECWISILDGRCVFSVCDRFQRIDFIFAPKPPSDYKYEKLAI